MKLYTYFRSSAAYRVRIALNLKGVSYEPVYVSLLKGDHKAPDYAALNPQALVPTLEHEGQALTQSLAIIDYLEALHPAPPLYPDAPTARAQALSMAMLIGCDIHPLNNLRVLKYLKEDLGQQQEAVDAWYQRWVTDGFAALEALAQVHGSDERCLGEVVTIADVFLAPQMWNARRFKVDLTPFPRLVAIDASLNQIEAFQRAAPEAQGDAF